MTEEISFEIGDKIICIDSGFQTHNTADELVSRDMGNLEKGRHYTVKDVVSHHSGGRLILDEINRGPNEIGFYAARFHLVTPAA